MVLKKLDVPLAAIFSTLGRTAARGLECSWAAHKMKYFYGKLMANLKAGKRDTANIDKWEPATWPKEAKGVGFVEAPRGALGHWIKIKDTRIDNYQCIVPTTWNASPRDTRNQIGAYEASSPRAAVRPSVENSAVNGTSSFFSTMSTGSLNSGLPEA